jgi:hypothetical protein
VQGLAAYAYAAGIQEFDYTQNQDIQFDLGGLVFPNVGITPPAPNGSTFVVLSAGDYEYDFYFAAHVLVNPATVGLDLAIFLNGVSAGPAHTFRSNHNASGSADDELVVRGQGLLSIAAGTLVTLRFVSPTKGTATANGAGSVQGANRTLSLKKLSA